MTSDANAEQIEYWNADEARHWVTHEARYDRMLRPLGEHALDAAAIRESDRVLDVGCGTGGTALAAARRAQGGTALGVDISRHVVERARERAREEGVANARFEQADAQTHDFDPASFDVAISRFGMMFFDDPTAALANLGRALSPGGRLAFVCWQDLAANEWMMVPGAAAMEHVPAPDLGEPGAPGPFAFADRDRVADLLDDAGWVEVAIEPRTESLLLGGGAPLDETVEFLRGTGMARALFTEADAEAVERAVEAVRQALEPHATAEGVRLGAAVWVVTARQP